MLARSNIEASPRELEQYYRSLEEFSLAPLWTAQDIGAMAQGPAPKVQPYVWHWRDLRPKAMQATELVGTAQAERRVLRLLNPGIKDRTATTNTLFAGLQIVMPGEIARAHRHTPAALRFIIESEGGYTNVNGEPIPMRPGDLVLTPNWTWHDHANNSSKPMIWLDGLDVPLVRLLDAAFQEEYSEETQPLSEGHGLGRAKYGAGALRPAWEGHAAGYSPLMHYPWAETRAALERLAALAQGSPFDGVIMEYTNPATGGPVMPTMACHIQLLRPGQRTEAHRHTSSAIYHVVEGRGVSVVAGKELDWEARDTFCVPNWAYHHHVNTSSTEPAILFSYTDAPVLAGISLLREEPLERA